MKTKLLHHLRKKAAKNIIIEEHYKTSDMTTFFIYKKGKIVFKKTCLLGEYEKVKQNVFNKCDEIMRNYILEEVKKWEPYITCPIK